ncbi:Transcriptional activator protein acu-15, partial [Neofusicoccum parvum]
MGRLVSNGQQVSIFAGSSTGVHFISQAEQKLQMLRIHTDSFPSGVYSLYLNSIWSTPPKNSDADLIAAIVAQLPPNTEEIVEAAIDHWTPLYPIVHKPTTLSALRHLLASPATSTLAILHQTLHLLALGTINHPNPSCPHFHTHHFLCTSEPYHALTTPLTPLLLSAAPSLPTLQALVLAQLYAQLSTRPSLATHLNGAAVRLAQSLGLHRHSQRFRFDALDSELRRRAWHSQHALDAFGSAAAGLPRLVRERDVDADECARAASDDAVTRLDVGAPLPGERSA